MRREQMYSLRDNASSSEGLSDEERANVFPKRPVPRASLMRREQMYSLRDNTSSSEGLSDEERANVFPPKRQGFKLL